MSVNATATRPSLRAGKSAFSLALCVLALGWAAGVPAQQSQERNSSGYVDRLPAGYRNWELVSVAREAGMNNDIRAILGNRIAIEAFRNGTRPFPDGAVIARLAWQYQSSARNDAVFPAPQSFVAGLPTNVQVIVKDSKRFNATGGWGYGQFEDGKPDLNAALAQACFACHAKLDRSEDFVFTAYAR
jgi:hypothetical protein